MNNVSVALIRGINVGGHKKFPKADQLQMLETLGYKNAQVYLHTGNWVFTTSKSTSEISEQIQKAIATQFGWDVPVLVFKASEIEQIFNDCPFSSVMKEKSYFTLLEKPPTVTNKHMLNALSYPGESLFLTNNCVYLYFEKGAGTAKFNNNLIERKLQMRATTRNYRTMVAILRLVYQ